MVGLKFVDGNTAQELNQVHTQMIAAYNINEYAGDVVRAKQMEDILRKIKNTKIVKDGEKTNLESAFDEQCYQIAEMALNSIQTVSGSDKLHANRLFMTTHSSGYELGKNMNVDDIAEAELAATIQSLQSLAFKDEINVGPIDIVSNTTGRVKGNLTDEAQRLMDDTTQGMVKQVIDRIQGTNFRNKAYQKIAAKLKDTQAKSIKADVISYNAELTAYLKPEWEKFNVFAGARFTVKNYIPKRKNGIAVQIHFGESNPYKSVMAQLDYLGYSFKQSQHIFFHSLNSWMKNSTKAVETHIPHLRFAYELQGSGLVDDDGMSISGADFLIVNDPTSYDGIYVRSTKAMIANALQSNNSSTEPFTSMQYIMYGDLISNKI